MQQCFFKEAQTAQTNLHLFRNPCTLVSAANNKLQSCHYYQGGFFHLVLVLCFHFKEKIIKKYLVCEVLNILCRNIEIFRKN